MPPFASTTHSTVSRRIDRLEDSLGTVLFDRQRGGYALTEAGRSLIVYAERMENALQEAVQDSAGTKAQVSGTVRVGAPEGFGLCVLSPSVPALRSAHPGLHVELMVQPQFASLATREVEILVTLDPPVTGRVVLVRIAQPEYFLYCSPSYRDSHEPIARIEDATGHEFVDYVQDGSVNNRYLVLDEILPGLRRVSTSNSVMAQRAAVAAGIGLSFMTPYVAEMADDLVCLLPGQVLLSRPLYLAAPEDLLRIRRIRVVWDHIRRLIDRHPRYFRPLPDPGSGLPNTHTALG